MLLQFIYFENYELTNLLRNEIVIASNQSCTLSVLSIEISLCANSNVDLHFSHDQHKLLRICWSSIVIYDTII